MSESNYPSHAAEYNRRESQRSTRSSIQMQDEDEDDYALAAMGISNGGGYRPSDSNQNAYTPPPPQQPQSQLPPLERRRASTPPPRPSSTTKPKGIDSFALRNEGGMGQMSRGPAFAFPVGNGNGNGLTRTSTASSISSASSDSTIMRPESPYQGPTGPSHPYNMYSQESRLARTASIATTSTMPVPPQELSYTGPSGPTHPYGMYPQSTVSSYSDHLPAAPPISVGFPGLNNDYQRRLGPEGEEAADLIGPDGHTEQLPPYTKYPDEAFARKARPTSIPVPVSIPTIQMPAPIVPISGAGGMGLATRNPEFSSQEDLRSPHSRQSARSIMSDRNSHHVDTAATEYNEKPQLKKWQVAAKKKLCSIVPVWVIVLIVLVFVIFSIVLGAVFTILRPKHNRDPNKPHHDGGGKSSQTTVYATMTTTFDATPLSTLPVRLPSLPTGTYNMPLGVPSTAQSSCIVNAAEISAWSCSIAMTPLEMTITDVPGADELRNKEIMMNFGNASLDFYPYGAQPPILNFAQVMSLVNDTEFPSRGPAWFFQIPYNKVVVLPQKALSTNTNLNSNSRRAQPAAGFMGRKGVAQVGDQPWFCYWNGTLLEAFIYVNDTSSAGSSMVTSSYLPATPNGGYGGYRTSTYSSDVPSSTHGVESQGSPSSGATQPNGPQFLPPYPKVYKIAERRIPQGVQTVPAYCVAHQILSDGNAAPLMNSTGQPITIYLNETHPTSFSSLQDRGHVSDLFKRDLVERDGDGSCGCVWIES
ncbi:hypothetical protein DSL72_004675 [Monilinia vaccinii-corymbosi]|uniref:DUF7820 domain-containing protein n=1 Tax=Monilinia vaccinii-corymbosi TaxID=61207 RepID=A0A8A3NWV0_9HELO|nr:hypothetical protein DSL72_004675 [Monilinia vaccinii-corymbosi]